MAAPISWGGVLPAGALVIEALAFSAAAAAFLGGSPSWRVGPPLPLAMLSGLVLLGLLQLAPLPRAILRILSPVSLQVYEETSTILALFGTGSVLPPAISIAPCETISTLLLLLAYLAAFLAASRVLTTRPRRRLFLGAVFASALLQMGIATLTGGGSRKTGSFVNPNHLAGYLEIPLALAFGVAWSVFTVGHHRSRRLPDIRDRLQRRLPPLLLAVLLWGAIAIGIGLTQSRGGVIASLLATLLLVALLALRHQLSRRDSALRGTLILLGGILVVALVLGSLPIARILATDPLDLDADGRFRLWTGSLQAFSQFPVAGSGLGTFREAYRRIQPGDFRGLVEQAHSDSLQLLVTGGAIGALLGALALVSGIFHLLAAARRQRHPEELALLLSALAALASLTLHGLVEFNLSIPAIPVTLAAVLGASWAASPPDPIPETATASRPPGRERPE